MLEQAILSEYSGSTDGDPYWGALWEAAPKTAGAILRRTWSQNLKTLELGCGIGVTGIAAFIMGHDVTFSDRSAAAVNLSMANARLNGFAHAGGLVFDWKHPPAAQFELIVASDILYDSGNHEPLLMTLQTMLSATGVAWIGDPGRANSICFAELARQNNWCIETLDEFAQPHPQPVHAKFRLLALQRSYNPNPSLLSQRRDPPFRNVKF